MKKASVWVCSIIAAVLIPPTSSSWSKGSAPSVRTARRVAAPHGNPMVTLQIRDAEFLAIRHTEFPEMRHIGSPGKEEAGCDSTCPNIEFPEAIFTPLPSAAGAKAKLTVDFIVGRDGRVESLIILESAGPTQDKIVARTLSSWRYRPATCYGVPTEVEGRVKFSTR